MKSDYDNRLSEGYPGVSHVGRAEWQIRHSASLRSQLFALGLKHVALIQVNEHITFIFKQSTTRRSVGSLSLFPSAREAGETGGKRRTPGRRGGVRSTPTPGYAAAGQLLVLRLHPPPTSELPRPLLVRYRPDRCGGRKGTKVRLLTRISNCASTHEHFTTSESVQSWQKLD